ncbi:MAG: exodeoxyribonuclease VII large subunit [Chlamydiae bacterium]|nr:exodeoxyribonuclease VII large subunit [Chlamydiota bacterium]
MKALSVTELTLQIKKQLETGFASLLVQGEISNIKLQSSGHYYFTLKDPSSQISAVLFKGQTRHLSRAPKEGDKVVVQGELSVYAPRGNYQLIVKSIDFLGVGTLLLKLHALKEKLQLQGLFDPSQKKAIPKFPKTIGVVTSPTGAVIQDILQILERRAKGFHLILNPVKVQGEGAAEEIAKAIDQFNQHNLCDVMIVGRGGGSLEDLWAFNEEIVVRAIASSKIPVISAVGHETDISLSDFAADLRAPTPSAAAEICTAEKVQQQAFLQRSTSQLQFAIQSKLQTAKRQLKTFQRHPYLTSSSHILSSRWQDIDEIRQKADQTLHSFIMQKKFHLDAKKEQTLLLNPVHQITIFKKKFDLFDKSIGNALKNKINTHKKNVLAANLQKRIDQSMWTTLQSKNQSLQRLLAHLTALNPKNLLTKGYCILFSEKKDSVILHAKDTTLNQKLCILMQDGELEVEVQKKPCQTTLQ